MKNALKTGGWLIVVAWAILVACWPGGSGSGGDPLPEEAVTVTSPAAGDTWRLGETRVIRWSASADDGRIVMIYLTQWTSDKDWAISSSVPLSTGEMKWKVGVLESGGIVKPGKYWINLRDDVRPGAYHQVAQSGQFTIGPHP
jgi:hypothetical protein